MPDDRPRGSCVIDGCPRDPWRRDDGRLPLVCGPDLSWIRAMLREIPEYVAELAGGGFVMRDSGVQRRHGDGTAAQPRVVWPVNHEHAGEPVPHRDLVANVLPAGPMAGSARGGRVAGSPEPRLPINEDAADLLAPAWRRTPAAAVLAEAAYPEQDDDQIGFLPVAVLLDQWADDLRTHRDVGEGRPEPSVTVLCRWLLERLDDAALDWLPIDEFFTDLRQAHGALRGQLGLIDVPTYYRGIPCPKCSLLTLLRHPGKDHIQCSACGVLLTTDEYERHVKSMSAEALAEQKRAAAERRTVVRLLREMHAVGWRHQMHEPGRDIDDEPMPLVHRWVRGTETIDLTTVEDSSYGGLWYADDDEAEVVGSVGVSTRWVATNGVARLHRLASAAGVLSAPRERAA